MSGFIALHREAFAHPVLKDGERFRAWFWLVANAAWKPTRHDARGRTILVERGQICVGREHLAKEWKWSPSAVERFLTRLETEHMIERETGQGKSLITICNYEKYQDAPNDTEHMSGQQTGQKSDRNRTAKEQGNKETRLEEEEANASPSSARARKPDPFPMPEWADPQVWTDFLANRRKKSRPNTATAHKRMLSDIAKLTNAHWPPGRLLEHAAAQGWAGIYEPKDGYHGNRTQNDRLAASRDYSRPVRVDGFTAAINAALEQSGSEYPADQAGRSDDAPPAGNSVVAFARPRALF